MMASITLHLAKHGVDITGDARPVPIFLFCCWSKLDILVLADNSSHMTQSIFVSVHKMCYQKQCVVQSRQHSRFGLVLFTNFGKFSSARWNWVSGLRGFVSALLTDLSNRVETKLRAPRGPNLQVWLNHYSWLGIHRGDKGDNNLWTALKCSLRNLWRDP